MMQYQNADRLLQGTLRKTALMIFMLDELDKAGAIHDPQKLREWIDWHIWMDSESYVRGSEDAPLSAQEIRRTAKCLDFSIDRDTWRSAHEIASKKSDELCAQVPGGLPGPAAPSDHWYDNLRAGQQRFLHILGRSVARLARALEFMTEGQADKQDIAKKINAFLKTRCPVSFRAFFDLNDIVKYKDRCHVYRWHAEFLDQEMPDLHPDVIAEAFMRAEENADACAEILQDVAEHILSNKNIETRPFVAVGEQL